MNDPFEIVGVRPELLERQAPKKEKMVSGSSLAVCHCSSDNRWWMSVL